MKRLLGGVSDLFATWASAGEFGSIHELEDDTNAVTAKPAAKVAQLPVSGAQSRKRLTGVTPVAVKSADLKYITRIG